MSVKLIIDDNDLTKILNNESEMYSVVEDCIADITGVVETHQLIFQDIETYDFYSVYYEYVPDTALQWISVPIKVIKKSITTEYWIEQK